MSDSALWAIGSGAGEDSGFGEHWWGGVKEMRFLVWEVANGGRGGEGRMVRAVLWYDACIGWKDTDTRIVFHIDRRSKESNAYRQLRETIKRPLH